MEAIVTEFIVFNKDVLHWALKRANISAEQFSDQRPLVESWLSGKKKPTIDQTRELSEKLAVPFGYFCLSEPPKDNLNLVDFRTADSRLAAEISLELRKTIQQAKEHQELESDRVEENDCRTFGYKNALNLQMNAEEGARVLLQILGGRQTELDPEENYRALCSRIEKSGVLVQRSCTVPDSPTVQPDSSEFSGFALFDDYAPLIFVNENISDKARIFALVREFCHILLGVSGVSGDVFESDKIENKVEKFCVDIANEYLRPQGEP